MSTPVKPPDPGHLLQQVEHLSGSPDAEKPSAALQEAAGTQAEPVRRPGPADQASDPVQQIANALRAGEIDPAKATEMLVERALATASRAELSGQERQQIASVLRLALQNDPTLVAMLDDLERQAG
jgi:hypothetical protein